MGPLRSRGRRVHKGDLTLSPFLLSTIHSRKKFLLGILRFPLPSSPLSLEHISSSSSENSSQARLASAQSFFCPKPAIALEMDLHIIAESKSNHSWTITTKRKQTSCRYHSFTDPFPTQSINPSLKPFISHKSLNTFQA
nr:hypothetical protein Iba_chr08cCG11740 [Ipomoea batatas]